MAIIFSRLNREEGRRRLQKRMWEPWHFGPSSLYHSCIWFPDLILLVKSCTISFDIPFLCAALNYARLQNVPIRALSSLLCCQKSADFALLNQNKQCQNIRVLHFPSFSEAECKTPLICSMLLQREKGKRKGRITLGREKRSESDMDNGADWQIAAARNLLLHRRQCVANIA